jgi:REP element-mobilizing transposase RayT
LYLPQGCEAAYQLDWSYSLFWNSPPATRDWFEPLQQACEQDHIRLLQERWKDPNTSQFLVSTQPQVAPLLIAQRVKGRLQHLLRARGTPASFQRNYALRSIGSTGREKLEHYVAGQLEHHPLADPRTERLLAKYQIHHPEIDLSEARATTHARYWHNLHLVFVHEGRWREVSEEVVRKVRDTIEASAKKKGHLLARAALLPDHVHLLLGARLDESPEEIALAYLNNLAYCQGMRPIYRFSYFVGTFSEYDLGVIPRPE